MATYGASVGWSHIGSDEYWSDLADWAAGVGEGWAHGRDLVAEPLTARECVCKSSDCVFKLYEESSKRRATTKRMREDEGEKQREKERERKKKEKQKRKEEEEEG